MLRTVEISSLAPLPTADLAASFEQVVVDVLVERSLRCATDHGLEDLVMVGGVAANRRLRRTLQQRSDAIGVRVSVTPAGLLHRQCRHDWCGGLVALGEWCTGLFLADWGVSPLVSGAG